MIYSRFAHTVSLLALLTMVVFCPILKANLVSNSISFEDGRTSSFLMNTSVAFSNSTVLLPESTLNYDLCVDILNMNIDTSTTVEVILVSGEAARLADFVAQTLTFPANDATQQCVSISISEDVACSGNSNFTFELQNIIGEEFAEIGTQNSFELVLEDDELNTITIVSQDFETSPADDWIQTSLPTFYTVSDDIWDIVGSLGGVTAAASGSSFLGMQDLNNPNGGGDFFHTIAFDTIDVSTYFNSTIQFDYNVQGFLNGDTLRYELVFDEVAQGVVSLVEGEIGGVFTNGWIRETLIIPSGVNEVSISIFAIQEGESAQAGLDNFKITGQQCNCTTDAGNLVGNSTFDNVICLGEDLLNENGTSVSFLASYVSLDESYPGVFGTDYLFLLTNSAGTIIDISFSGDFDFSSITAAGDYSIFGLSYAISNTPNTISAYLNTIGTDENANDIAQITAEDVADDLCLSLGGIDDANNPVVLTIEEEPSLLNLAATQPATCGGNEGSLLFSIAPNETSPSNYSIQFDLNETTYSVAVTSSEGTASSGIFETLEIENLFEGTYSNFTITKTSSGCSSTYPTTITLIDPIPPSPSITSIIDPNQCEGTNGSISIGGLIDGLDYSISFTRDGLNGSAGPFTSNASNEITLPNLIAAHYNSIAVTESESGCEGGNMNTTLSDPSAPSINELSSANVCPLEIESYNLTQYEATITSETGTFTWYLGNPNTTGTIINSPEFVSVSDGEEYFVVFENAATVCKSMTSIELSVYEAVEVNISPSTCNENADVYSASFSVITNTDDVVQVTGDNLQNYTPNLLTEDNINYTLDNIPNGVNLTIEVNREGNICPMASANLEGISCCYADAGNILPETTQEICEGMESPLFSAYFSEADENIPNAEYIYVWLLTQDNTEIGGAATEIVASHVVGINTGYSTSFSGLNIGEYCVNGLSYFGSEAQFLAEGFVSSQEILDAISNDEICADIDLSTCIPLMVSPLMEVANYELYECVDEDGFADFDLTKASEFIDLEGGNIVTYHATLNEAENNISPITSLYSAANGTVLFVRVENEIACVSTAQLTLNTVLCEATISDPCSCRANPANATTNGNASTETNGQFDEEIEVDAPSGQVWYIQSVFGLFSPSSAQPPVAPTPMVTGLGGQLLTETSNGDGTSTYTLEGLHIDSQGYSITVTNGVDVLDMTNTCFYPTLSMESAPSSICYFTPAFDIVGMEVNGGIPDLTTFNIYDETNTLVQSNNANQITINPAVLGLGNYTIEFVFDAGEPGAQDLTDPGCTQTLTQNFTIEATPSQMACNDNLQISVGDNCASLITPDMILEGTVGCEDDYEVQILNVFNQNLGNTTSPDMIGESYVVRVYHLPSNNYCWGSITVEDKQDPFFDCPTSNVLISCFDEFDNVGAPIGLDNCDSNPSVVLINQSINDSDPCTPTFVTRIYIATDASGNQSEECEQIIELISPDLPDFPENIIFTCEQYAAYPTITDARSLDNSITDSDLSDDDIDVSTTTSNSILNTTGAGLPDIASGIYCQYSMTFSDDTIATCGNSFHILRTFTVLDWCSSTVITTDINGDDNIQIVEVRDDVNPVLTQSDFVVSANVYGNHPQPCRSTDFLFPAVISDNCNEIVDVKIYTPLGEANYFNGLDGTQGGYITSPGLTLGFHTITYTATDACGNIGTTSIQIEVVDDESPTPVCDLITTTVLGSNGTAVIPAETFDDGSNDNCGIQQMLVRRITDNCGISGNTTFGETVTFCCEDLDLDQISVEFKVIDYFGNENTCLVFVLVDENLAPNITYCPPSTSITCDDYIQNFQFELESDDLSVLEQFGTATFYDNCSFIPIENFTLNIDNCGRGTINRIFTAEDNQGHSSPTCSQTITVNHISDFVVEFPEDLNYVCSEGENPQEDGYFGEPIIFYDDCELVAVSSEDMTFSVVNDACYKIWRTWTVINWCVYGTIEGNPVLETAEIDLPGGSLDFDSDKDERTFKDGLNSANYPNATSDGIISYVQEIRVMDNDAPVFDEIASFEVCIEGNDCFATVNLPTGIAEDCSPNISYSVTSDFGLGFGPFTEIEAGVYDVVYTAMDNCGNSSSTTFEVEVRDCKAPTPYCVGGLVVELSPIDTDQDGTPDAGEVELWASDFDAGSFDNCSENVQVSFSSDVTDTNVTYTCDSVGFLAVYLWVTDEEGNQDVCLTTVEVESVDNVCGALSPSIAGYIEREDGQGVLQVEVNVSAANTNMDMSNDEGFFEVENLEMGYDYSVIPTKDEEDILGVTTYDILIIRSHILGINLLDSPYKIIAADANNSQSVTTADIIEIKKLILTNIPAFQNNTSWRFVDKYFSFPNELNPWETVFPEFKSYNNLNSPVYVADFTAIKIGDVNNSAVINLSNEIVEERVNNTFLLEVEDRIVNKGELIEVDFGMYEKLNLLGMQWSLKFDQEALEFVEIREGKEVKKEDFGLAFLENGCITNSFTDITGTKLALNETLFGFSFIAQKDGQLSDWLEINSHFVKSEAYLSFSEFANVGLIFKAIEKKDKLVTLYQNEPNPFSDKTEIGFYLDKEKNVIFRVFSAAGKEIYRKEGVFKAGNHQLEFSKNNLAKRGILYYQIETNSGIITKKMVLL